MSKSEALPIPDDGNIVDYERYHATLRLMKVVARAKRELIDNDNHLSWRTRLDLGAALTMARVWLNVSEADLNEP
jgi:hypothetical protein